MAARPPATSATRQRRAYSSTTRVGTLNPAATLAANTEFTATLSASIKDVAGNPLAATTQSFTTGA